MSFESGSITPADLLNSADPRDADTWLARLGSANDMVQEMQGKGRRSVCVASTIAFTHFGIVGNFDFTDPVKFLNIPEMAGTVADAAMERADETQFTSIEPLGKEKLKQTLAGIHSAWFASTRTKRGEGHMIGIVPGRFAGEYISWDTSTELPILKPFKTDTLLEELNGKLTDGIYAGSIFSFRSK